MCLEPVSRRCSQEARGTPKVTSGPAGALTLTVSRLPARLFASPRRSPVSVRPAKTAGSLTQSSSEDPLPRRWPCTVVPPGSGRATSIVRSAVTMVVGVMKSARLRLGVLRLGVFLGDGLVAGGDPQRPVQLPGGARRLRPGVPGHLDGHVEEAVVNRGVTARQERPHLAAEVRPVHVHDLVLLVGPTDCLDVLAGAHGAVLS